MKTKKFSIVVISDDCAAHSGFGTVIRNLFGRIHKDHYTELNITQISCFSRSHQDRRSIPIIKTKATLADKHGIDTFLQYCTVHGHPDVVFLLGDWWYWNLNLLNKTWRDSNKITSKVWYYVPLDGITLSEEAKSAYRGADKLIAMSPFGVVELEKYTGVTPEYIPHGFDDSLFRYNPPLTIGMRDFKNGAVYTFGAVSRNSRRKNVWAIASAFKMLQQQLEFLKVQFGVPYLKFKLLLHVPKDDPLGGDLQKYIDTLGCEGIEFTNKIHLAEGISSGVDDKDLQKEVYDNIDCLISAGREGFGLPYLEARACGIPLILPRYSGHYSMNYNEVTQYSFAGFRPEPSTDVLDMQVNPKDIYEAMLIVLNKYWNHQPEPLVEHDMGTWDVQAKKLYTLFKIEENRPKTINSIQVIRKIGGFGDALSLTPALQALHEKYPSSTISLVLDKKYHSAITLDCINLVEAPKDADLTYNVYSPDPCAVSEAKDLKEHGHFVKSRMQAFADALDVDIFNIKKPILNLKEKEKYDSQYIIIQKQAAEEYKSYTDWEQLVKNLVIEFKNHEIILEDLGKFYNARLIGNQHNPLNLIPVFINPDSYYYVIRDAKLCIGYDSFLLHICHALDVPFVGILGPTHPTARTGSARYSQAITAKLECIGCGRWSKSNCKVTNSLVSHCMTSNALSVDEIVNKIKSMLNEYNTHNVELLSNG